MDRGRFPITHAHVDVRAALPYAVRDMHDGSDEFVREVCGAAADPPLSIAERLSAAELEIAALKRTLERTQDQLVQAAKLASLGELSAGLLHELNQPLNVLGGYVEILREGKLAEGSHTRALDVMERAVDRMVRMVEHLRTFSRGGRPTVAVVDVAAVLTLAHELTVGALRRGVVVTCAPGLFVLGDANRLEQVVINLLANALQCEGDPVVLNARALDDDTVAIEVADRGPGVPTALRARIFEPFFTTKPAGRGTGLGLSVSARIVQDHGGRIEADDNPEGGALFRVVLPRHHPPASPPAPERTA